MSYKSSRHDHASVLLSVEHLQYASKTDHLAPKIDLNKHYQIRIPDIKDWHTRIKSADSGRHIYTNSSKMDTGTGSGVYSEESSNCSFRLPNRCRVFQAEICPTDKAPKTIRLIDLPKTNFTILVNNQGSGLR